MEKTNAIRLLEQKNIQFDLQSYEVDDSDLSAVSVAGKTGIDIDRIFKTLVLRSNTGEIFICVIPGAWELDLKKAAKESGHKKVDLIAVKELQFLTGYIRGGCSPIGMKKNYPAYIDESCLLFDTICISAGVRGLQVKIKPADLIALVEAEVVDLI